MLSKTHITLGMASALLLTCPETVPGVITAVAGGALGGWVVDVDAQNKKRRQNKRRVREAAWIKVLCGVFVGAVLILDCAVGGGMFRYVTGHWGVAVGAGLLGFLLLLIAGSRTEHRTFTHSLLGMALFCGAVRFACRPAAVPFLIGYASHLAADLLNLRGVQLLFPVRWFPSLKLCRSDGRANQILFWVTLGLTAAVGAILLGTALSAVPA